MKQTKRKSIRWITFTAVFLAMNIGLSSFGVPVPGGHFYLNDIVIVLAALLLDPLGAFIAGGIGAFLGDLFFYPLPMWASLITRGVQSVVISVFSHYLGKKRPKLFSSIGTAIGAVIMVAGYSLCRAFWYSTPAYAVAKLPYQILQAVLGAVLGLLLAWKFGVVKLYHRFVPEVAQSPADRNEQPEDTLAQPSGESAQDVGSDHERQGPDDQNSQS